MGSGATTLVDCLLARQYQNITAVDISEKALSQLQARLGEKKASQVRWIVDDITQPTVVSDLKDIAIWHDRAMLHFLTDTGGQQAYLSTLKKVLRTGGYVIIAAFALDGAEKCSGLNVRRSDAYSLAAFLGDAFSLIESLDYVYRMPSGDLRPYVYVRFQLKGI